VAGLVARLLARRDIAGLDGLDPSPIRHGRQVGALAVGNGLASLLGHRRPSDEGLEVTYCTAAADSVHRHGRVAELAGSAVRSVEDAALGDDGAADTGRDGQVDEVGAAASRSEGHLAQGRNVGVALQEGRQAQGGCHLSRNRHVDELGAHVRRLDDQPAPRVDGARSADADADDGISALGRSPFQGGAQRRPARVKDRRRTVGYRRSAPGLRDSRSIVEHDGRSDVRAADVEGEYGSC
jgi:hypothetical protein